MTLGNRKALKHSLPFNTRNTPKATVLKEPASWDGECKFASHQGNVFFSLLKRTSDMLAMVEAPL